MPVIYGKLIKDRIKLNQKEDALKKKANEYSAISSILKKTAEKKPLETQPIIYGDLYNKRVKESEKEDIIRKRLSQISYSARNGKRQAEQPQREGVVMLGQLQNQPPAVSAITKEMIDEYQEAEKLKPILIEGEIRKYTPSTYQPNLDFSDLQTTEPIENQIKEYEKDGYIFATKMTDIDNEILSTDENFQRIKNEINEKGSNILRIYKMRKEMGKLEKLKEEQKSLRKDIDLNNIRIKNLKDGFDNVKKHNAEVAFKNREEVLKFEQSLNQVNKNRLNLQQQPYETEFDYYNRLREVEKEKYDPTLYKKYAENEQTKNLKTNLNSLFDNTTFKEEVLTHISPTDKFIINKHFDEIEEAFLERLGYNNKTMNAKMVANALITLSNVYGNEASTKIQSAIRNKLAKKQLEKNRIKQAEQDQINAERNRLLEANRGIAMERAQQRQAERQEQINERQQRISAREAKELENQLRREYEQTQIKEERNAERQEQINEREQRISAREARAEQKAQEQERTQQSLERAIARRNAYKEKLASTNIQRIVRGKQGRDLAKEKKIEKQIEEQEQFIKAFEENLQNLPNPREIQANIQREQEEIKINRQINKLEKKRRDSDLSEAETVELENLIRRRADFGKKRMPYKVPKNYKASKVIENAYVNRLARQEMKRLKTIREAQGQGIRGRYIPKKRNVTISKTDLLKNRLNLITAEIKAGNDNPKLIVELNKLYKKLYDINEAYLFLKK